MQYLEGETLADRLARGALPVDQAIRHAVEIAGALDKAHRAGVVHRDLKPANVVLTKSGAKLLDFGLAKVTAPRGAPGVTGLSMLPTTPALGGAAGGNLTVQGTILGTFQYMAPEQLEGHEADARTDLCAFGALLYEMLTGKKAFEGIVVDGATTNVGASRQASLDDAGGIDRNLRLRGAGRCGRRVAARRRG